MIKLLWNWFRLVNCQWVSWQAFEKPSIRLKRIHRRMIERIGGQPTMHPTTLWLWDIIKITRLMWAAHKTILAALNPLDSSTFLYFFNKFIIKKNAFSSILNRSRELINLPYSPSLTDLLIKTIGTNER